VEPSNLTKAAHAMGTATLWCPFCGACNRPRVDGHGEVTYLERRQDGEVFCTVCSKVWQCDCSTVR